MKKWLLALALSAGLVSTGNAAYINRLKTFTGVASQWPWQLNTDGTWTSKRPDADDITFTQGATGAVTTNVFDAIKRTYDLSQWGVVCDGSDERAKVQAALDAVPAGSKLINSCSSLVGIGKNPSTLYGLSTNKPVELICTNGGGFKPLSSLANSYDVINFIGSAYSFYPTGIDGCFIGDNTTGSRYGLNAVTFDTSAAGVEFVRPYIRRSYIQQNSSAPTGYGLVFFNNGALNPVGGTHNATVCEDSIVYGGMSFNGVGDSIVLRNCLSTGQNMIYVNLVNAAGGMAGNFVFDGGPISNAGGLRIDCAASAQIINVEAEQNLTTTSETASLYDIAGAVCTTYGVTITGGQVQSDPGKGLSQLVRVGNAVGTVLDNLRIAVPTALLTPVNVTNLSTGTVIGAGNTFIGGGTNIDNGTGTLQTVSVPFGSGGSSQVLLRTTAGGAFTVARLAVDDLATIAANTVLANVSGSTASPSAVALPSCSSAGNVLWYTTNTGWSCHTIVSSDLPAATTSNLGAVKTDGATLANSSGAISVNPTTINGTSCTPGSTCNVTPSYTSALGADVSMTSAATYFDGPSVAQGTSGTWKVSATATLLDTSNISVYSCKIWDGTTVIASSSFSALGVSAYGTIALSGTITNPAANLKLSCSNEYQTTSKIKFQSLAGDGGGTRITAVRIN